MEVIKFIVDSVDNSATSAGGSGSATGYVFGGMAANAMAVAGAINKLRNDTESFAQKIRDGSPSVEIAMTKRDIVRLQSNRETERIAGPNIKNYLNAATETDRQWQRLETQLYKIQADVMRPIEEIKQAIIGRIVTHLEKNNDYFKDMFDPDLWQTAIAAFIAAFFGEAPATIQVLWEEYEKRKNAAEMAKDIRMDALMEFLKTPLMPNPINNAPPLGVPFNVGV